MFPIRDHNPSGQTPYVTIALIIANLVMFAMTTPWLGGSVALWQDLALYPVAVVHGVNLWGLLSHMFLHAGLLHLGGNLLFLWIFGDNLEAQMGHLGFLLFYLLCGLAAAGAQIASDPWTLVPMIGASGAIAGVMGGYVLMFPRARVDVVAIILIFVKVVTLRAWVVLGLWFLLQLFGSFSLAGDGVAYWAHIGGFMAGVTLCLPLFLRRGGLAFWRITHGKPPHPGIEYARSRIPVVRR